ncbi:MAG: formate/nitrite transporter family protein [Rubrobacteraceae bacterium]
MASSKTAGEILETVIEDGEKELERANAGLAFSGFAAGLNLSFGVIAMAVVGAMTGGIGLTAMLVYPIGFLIVILGRAQLFTENTVTPVTVVLTQHNQLPNMLRMWTVIFISNLLGTLVFAAVVVYGGVLEGFPLDLLLKEADHLLGYGFWTVGIKAVFGGWLVALIAWLVASSRDTISQIFFIYVIAFLIPAAGLAHSIAGSSEILMSVFAGNTSFLEYLGGFLLPTTLGNIIGGVVLVTLLNFGQVIGSKPKSMKEKLRESK